MSDNEIRRNETKSLPPVVDRSIVRITGRYPLSLSPSGVRPGVVKKLFITINKGARSVSGSTTVILSLILF